MLNELNIDAAIEDPTPFGFSWGSAPVAKGSGDKAVIVNPNAPHIVHENIDLMCKYFGPAYFLNSANGTSARVRDQRVTRDAALKGDKDVKSLKRKVLQAALGQRVRNVATVVTVTERIYCAPDGTEFTDKQEMLDYTALLTEK